MNHIDQLRIEIRRDFYEKSFQGYDFESFQSPSAQFRLDTTPSESKEVNWELTKVEVFDQRLNERIFDFYVNETHFFHGWVKATEIDYLICAEDIFGGQTVIDLTNRRMAGYSPNEDGFIWTDFHLSPNGKTLATIGCYWGCSYVIKLFDFSEPMNLPLKEIKQIQLLGNDEVITGWVDNETLQMKGIKREVEPEYFEGGGMRMKILSETALERQIKIYDL